MKRLLIAIWLFGLLIFPVHAQSADSVLQGHNAYDEGQFEQAIVFYERALIEDPNNTEAMVNIGHSYFAFGEMGQALVWYRRAQTLLPRDTNIALSIARVYSQTGYDVPQEQGDIFISLGTLINSFLNWNELFLVGVIVWWLWWLVIIIQRLRRGKIIWRSPIIAGLGLCFALVMLVIGMRWGVSEGMPRGVIVNEQVIVRSGNGDDYLALYEVFAGLEFRHMETQEDWIRFRTADGREGWIPSHTVMFME